MNKLEVKAYFDERAPEWDTRLVRAQHKIDRILNAAGVQPGCSVLDVACGTGVLFEDYLARSAYQVTGVDISPQMIRIARRKYPQSHITVICADVEETLFPATFDSCVVYNALPHFPDPERLIAHLSRFICTGGRLCIAHAMSREALTRHHAGRAESVSCPIPEANALCELFAPYFIPETAISDDEKFIVAGVRRS